MRGYWQNYEYFQDISEALSREVSPRNEAPQSVASFLKAISSDTSVAVHVRRGDYLNEETRQIHGILPISYYEKLLDDIQSSTPGAHFFFFSDDPNWVSENLASNYSDSTVVRYPEQDAFPYWDVELMKQCSIHVIANSTFSWWGAYLARDPQKVVYVPKSWIDLPHNLNNKLLVKGWVTK